MKEGTIMSSKKYTLETVQKMISRIDELKRKLIPEINFQFKEAYSNKQLFLEEWHNQCNHVFYQCVIVGEYPFTNETEYYECSICGLRLVGSEHVESVGTLYRSYNTPYNTPEIPENRLTEVEYWKKQLLVLDENLKALENKLISLEEEYENLDEELIQISDCIDEYFEYFRCKGIKECAFTKELEYYNHNG